MAAFTTMSKQSKCFKLAKYRLSLKYIKSASEGSQSVQNFIGPTEIPLLSCYFVQGALGLSRLATTFFYKDELHLSPAETAAIVGITSIPWIIKPLYGFLSDVFPLWGYKRKSYLFFAGLAGCLSWVSMGTIVTTSSAAIIANLIASASVAISDVVVDSIVVERSRPVDTMAAPGNLGSNTIEYSTEKKDPADLLTISTDVESATQTAGDLQSLCWGASAFGGVLSAYFSGSLLQILSAREIFLLTAAFPLIISITSFFILETQQQGKLGWDIVISSVKNQSAQLFETFKNPRIYLPVLFIFLWQATPSAETAMFFYSTESLGFQPEFLGRVRLASSIAALLGVFIYRWKLKNIPTKSVIFWSTIASSLIGLTPVLLVTHFNRVLGIPDQIFSLADNVILTVLGQIAFMPTLVLASSLCPPGIEGTLFAR